MIHNWHKPVIDFLCYNIKSILMKKSILILFGFALIFFACSDNASSSETNTTTTETSHKADAPQKKTGQAFIKDDGSATNALQLAVSLPDFSTLVAAVQAAGVENALVNAGPLTVFAPLNSAFDKLPEGTVATLVKPENKAKLAFILPNHVAPSNYPISQLKKEAKKGRKLYMASGKYLEVEKKGDDIYVGGTKIIKSVKVSNGWVHVIDDVLVPAE